MSEEDEALDEMELREAEALARALERGSAEDGLPDEALSTAALIRYSVDGGALRKDREDAIMDEVIAAAERTRRRTGAAAPVLPWWRVFFGVAAGLGVAVVIAILVMRPAPSLEPTALPDPDISLLRAQAERREGDAEEFEQEMRTYRGEMYAALTERYETR